MRILCVSGGIDLTKKRKALLYTIMNGEITIEKLAEMARDEFAHMREEMATKEIVRNLGEEMHEDFSALRQEMQEGTRAVLAAIQSVEYTKLRMRIDAVEERLSRMEMTHK